MEFGFLERIIGKDVAVKLKVQIESVKAAWESHTKKVERDHREVMSAFEALNRRLDLIEGKKNNGGPGGGGAGPTDGGGASGGPGGNGPV